MQFSAEFPDTVPPLHPTAVDGLVGTATTVTVNGRSIPARIVGARVDGTSIVVSVEMDEDVPELRGQDTIRGMSVDGVDGSAWTVPDVPLADQHSWLNTSRWTPSPGVTGNVLKWMPPGHFCPDVCGLEDFGDADTWRGRAVRGFFRLMAWWPKPRGRRG